MWEKIQNDFHATRKVVISVKEVEDMKLFLLFLTGDPYRVATPTALESTLPWKREENDKNDGGGLQQNEFPAWASNKEYLAYNSPSATFLGKNTFIDFNYLIFKYTTTVIESLQRNYTVHFIYKVSFVYLFYQNFTTKCLQKKKQNLIKCKQLKTSNYKISCF